MRFSFLIVVGVLLVGGGMAAWGYMNTSDTVAIQAPNRVIRAEIVQTEEARQRGLSGREEICPDKNCEGMLFVFDESDRHGIWMKDMYFPIDIVWMDREGRVVDIAANVSPDTYPVVFRPRESARYVLEIGAGRTGELGIDSGSPLSFSL